MNIDLINKAIKQEIGSSVRYLEQYMATDESELKKDFKNNALDKFKQAMELADFVVKMGDFPDLGDGKLDQTVKQMITTDITTENKIISLYQKLLDDSDHSESKEFFENLISKEKERKKLLVCAKGRTNMKFAPI